MPSLNFVLPHWLYWGTLLIFPCIAWYLVERQRRRGIPKRPSLFIAYLLWLTAGMFGLHRFYLRSLWGFLFIPVFLGIIYVNDGIRDAREDVSRTRAALDSAHRDVTRLQPSPGVSLSPEAIVVCCCPAAGSATAMHSSRPNAAPLVCIFISVLL